jgi:hypothetical protein
MWIILSFNCWRASKSRFFTVETGVSNRQAI